MDADLWADLDSSNPPAPVRSGLHPFLSTSIGLRAPVTQGGVPWRQRVLGVGLVCVLLPGCVTRPPDAAEGTPQAIIRIGVSERVNPVSDLLYGHFAEFMFENIKGGLWAELLVNRGFDEVAPPPAAAHYWERYPDNRNHANGFFLDAGALGLSYQGHTSLAGDRAQILVNSLPGQHGHGIYQSNIPVRAGLTYHGSVWLRGTGVTGTGKGLQAAGRFEGSLVASLEQNRSGGAVYASRELDAIPGEWTRFDFDLPVNESNPLARFVLQIRGVGAVWVDQASLMPGDAVDNLRVDVMEKIRALEPAFVRWPGGNVAQDYHWQWGIGPRDERPTWVNMSWDNDPEPSDFGTIEFLRFCEAIGAEPNIVVNLEGRGATLREAVRLRAAGRDIRRDSLPATAEEAANWVEYVNGDASTRFGALRGRHGQQAPFDVAYWEIGNEIWGDWVRGHSDAATYAANARRYIEAMKAVDPDIKIIAVGDEDPDWNRTVLEEIGELIDYLSIHHYRPKADDPPGFAALMARPLWYEDLYGRVREMIRETVPGRDIAIAVNEWNTTFGTPRQHTMESALYGARLMNAFERQGDLIRMSAVSDLINGWPGGVIQASRHDVFTSATYSVIEAYNRHRGAWRLKADAECSVTHESGDPSLGESIPVLDVVVTSSDSGDELFIKVVNSSDRHSIRTALQLDSLTGRLRDSARVTTVTAPSLQASNTFAEPDRIAAEESEIRIPGNRFLYDFPVHSVTILRLGVSLPESAG